MGQRPHACPPADDATVGDLAATPNPRPTSVAFPGEVILTAGEMPAVLACMVEAVARNDADALEAVLAPDAVLRINDEGYLGAGAIRTWAEARVLGEGHAFEIFSADVDGDRITYVVKFVTGPTVTNLLRSQGTIVVRDGRIAEWALMPYEE